MHCQRDTGGYEHPSVFARDARALAQYDCSSEQNDRSDEEACRRNGQRRRAFECIARKDCSRTDGELR